MTRSTVARPDLQGAKSGTKAASAEPPRPKESFRETVESIVVAFVLALLVKGFEVEAFVIPTGSMAPTLMGRHKEVACPQCGYVYSVNAADEVEGPGSGRESRRVYSGICVNCRYQATRLDREPSFKGDRILVMKFLYDLASLPGSSGPRRWDVVVFRNPENPDEQSYIKRLVGLAGEILRVWHGDLFIKSPTSDHFEIARKPLAHQRAMEMMVYDDAHRPLASRDRPEWRRWTGRPQASVLEESIGHYTLTPSVDDWTELRYRHLVPDPVQWEAIAADEALPPSRPPRPTLVTDFYSYNTHLYADNSGLDPVLSGDQESAWMQPHWVGDLTLSARVSTASARGALRLELIEGEKSNRCEIDVATGEAVVTRDEGVLGRGKTSLRGPGVHDLVFSNVDNRLTLLVDGQPTFGDGLTYDDDPQTHPLPTAEDLTPARLAAKDAKFVVSDLVLKRDIYYTLYPGQPDYRGSYNFQMPGNPVALFDMLASPERVAGFGQLGFADYPIGKDRFMMMGDNSPRSHDSRRWSDIDQFVAGDSASGFPDRGWDTIGRNTYEVPRPMITGKAFCIYWPHGKPFWPNLRITQDFRIPFRPYFERMKWIH